MTQMRSKAEQMENKILLRADAINGILLIDSLIECDGAKLVDEEEFLSGLSTLPENKIIAAYVTDRVFSKVESEYGVSQ